MQIFPKYKHHTVEFTVTGYTYFTFKQFLPKCCPGARAGLASPQQHMADLLREGPDVAPSFLNSVLNQLNWAFSEFIGMIQEVGHRGALWAAGGRGRGTTCSVGRPLTMPAHVAGLRSSRLRSAWSGTTWTAGSSRYAPPALTCRSACCASWR